MRLHRGIPLCPPYPNGCVLTIGNFDGVHLGHKTVIEKLAQKGKSLGLPVAIMVFEPQPLEFFVPESAPTRLSRIGEKAFRLGQLPVDDLFIVRFNRELADCPPEAFVYELLVNRLHVKHLVIGDDFRFGKDRAGDFSLLKDTGLKAGFSVEDTGSLLIECMRASSTLVRKQLADGNLNAAEKILGYAYGVCGRVIHGDKRGRILGYPTANIKLSRKQPPLSGVFAVTVSGLEEGELEGVANIGTRPTVDGESQAILETHLFDFDRDIYGCKVSVNFKKKIRQEFRFRSVDELKQQITNDVAQARAYFAASRQQHNGL